MEMALWWPLESVLRIGVGERERGSGNWRHGQGLGDNGEAQRRMVATLIDLFFESGSDGV